jgi:LacI family transcriptional regulator
LARAIATARTQTFGALVTSLPGTWDAHLAEAVEDAAFHHDCSVLLGCSHEDAVRERQLVERFLENRVDALLVLPTFDSDAGYYQGLVDEGVRIVFLVWALAGVEADGVCTDNYQAGYLVGRHLAQLGRRHFAYVYPPLINHPENEERFRGFAAAASDGGLDPPALVRVPLGSGWAGTRAAVAEYLRSGSPIDAFFAFNDDMATDTLRALQQAGRRVPQEVAVVGFDDLPKAAESTPALTTVRAPLREIGKQAVEMMLRRLQAGDASPSPQRVFLEPTLVVRESTAGTQV